MGTMTPIVTANRIPIIRKEVHQKLYWNDCYTTEVAGRHHYMNIVTGITLPVMTVQNLMNSMSINLLNLLWNTDKSGILIGDK